MFDLGCCHLSLGYWSRVLRKNCRSFPKSGEEGQGCKGVLLQKWPKMSGLAEKLARFWLSGPVPGHSSAILEPPPPPPKKWPPVISPAIFRPFLVLGRFPFCSRPAESQIAMPNKDAPLENIPLERNTPAC